MTEDGNQLIRCSECGSNAEASAKSEHPERLVCYCGAKLMSGFDARLRCKRSEALSPEQSQEVLVVHLPDEEKPNKKPTKPAPRAVQPGGFDW